MINTIESSNSQGLVNRFTPASKDEHFISFGKYKEGGELSTKLQDIPATYLYWLYAECSEPLHIYVGRECHNHMPISMIEKIHLANYIYNSRNVLNEELAKISNNKHIQHKKVSEYDKS